MEEGEGSVRRERNDFGHEHEYDQAWSGHEAQGNASWQAALYNEQADQAGTFPGLDTAYAFQKSAENSNSISYPPSMYAQTLPTDASSSQRAHGSQQWSSGHLVGLEAKREKLTSESEYGLLAHQPMGQGFHEAASHPEEGDHLQNPAAARTEPEEEILLFEDAIDDLIPYFPVNNVEMADIGFTNFRSTAIFQGDWARNSTSRSLEGSEPHASHSSAPSAVQKGMAVPNAAQRAGSCLQDTGPSSLTEARRQHGRQQLSSIVGGVLQSAMSCCDGVPLQAGEVNKWMRKDKVYKGVKRDEWSVQWRASLEEKHNQEHQDLGRFADPVTAAKAHDIALLRLCSNKFDEKDLNFPKSSYDGEATAEMGQASVSEFVSTLHRCGKIGNRRSSRYLGVKKTLDKNFEAHISVSEDEGSQ